MKVTRPQACGDCLAERLIENITFLAPDLCVCKYCLREGGGGGRAVEARGRPECYGELLLALCHIREPESTRGVQQRTHRDGPSNGTPPGPVTSPGKGPG